MNVEERLKKLALELPVAPNPIASYVPYKRTGNLVYISGQGSYIKGKKNYTGKVGLNLTKEQGYEAAKFCGLNLLAILKEAIGDLNKVKQIVSVHGYVNSTDNFTDQPFVINGVSDLLIEIFGEAGKHSRCALSCNSLPMNIPVEVEMIVELFDE